MYSFLRRLFGLDQPPAGPRPAPDVNPPERPPPEGDAYDILGRMNPNALIGFENGHVCAIEDHTDPDGRMFRLEYQSTPDGRHAIAWCRNSPWGSNTDVHTTNDGLICVGPGAHDTDPARSSYDLEYVIARARFWCVGVSVVHEGGAFPE